MMPLWAESGMWGPQRHPAAPGKPWSVRRRRRVSGCRISSLCSSFMLYPPISRSGCIMHAARQPLSLQASPRVCSQARLHLLATPRLRCDLF